MSQRDSPISLRPAFPNLEEGRRYARYLDTAAEGFFRFLLGRESVEILAKAYLEPGHDLSHQSATFAERDGEIVGMVCGYTAEQHRRSPKDVLRRAAGRFPLRMRVISFVFAPMMRIIDTVQDGDYYAQAIAVDDDQRGSGIGTMLMEELERRAASEGASRLALDVAAGNTTARRLYERLGWVVESRWPRRMAIPRLTFLRMVKNCGESV